MHVDGLRLIYAHDTFSEVYFALSLADCSFVYGFIHSL